MATNAELADALKKAKEILKVCDSDVPCRDKISRIKRKAADIVDDLS